MDDAGFMHLAYEQALRSDNEGGLPIGAVMVEDGRVVVGEERNFAEHAELWDEDIAGNGG